MGLYFIDSLSKYLSYLKYIIRSKKKWVFPKKTKIIILDEHGSDRIIDLVLGHDECEVFEDRKETLNVPIFLLSLFNYHRYGRYTYRATYIKYTGAKHALTYIDTRVFYSDLFTLIPNCKLILIQNGTRRSTWWYPLAKDRKYDIDYYFTHCMEWSKFASNYVNANFFEIGHIAANKFKKSKFIKANKIQWISNWRIYDTYKWNDKVISWKVYYEACKTCLEPINEYCLNNNIDFEIIGTSLINGDKELEFYNSIINNFKFVPRSNIYSSHEKLENNAIICGIDSTLLYEAFGRGFRTAFFSIRAHYLNDFSLNFAAPKKNIEDFGLFWCNKPDKGHYLKIINYLFNVNEMDWKEQLIKYKNCTMDHNYGNTIIKDALRKEGVRID